MCRYFSDGTYPLKYPEGGKVFFEILKSAWYFLMREIIGFQKIFSGGKLMNSFFFLEKGGGRGSSGKIVKSIMPHGTFSYFISGGSEQN